jgi:hypothetical protein
MCCALITVQIHEAAARYYVREDCGRGQCSYAAVAAHYVKAELSHSKVVEFAAKAAAQSLVAHAYDEVSTHCNTPVSIYMRIRAFTVLQYA